MNLAANAGSRAVDLLSQSCAISLTYYELGNSVWKMHRLLKKISNEQSEMLLSLSLDLLAQLTELALDKREAKEIERMAFKRNITFYDSAYLYAAKREGLTLVTDDEPLSKAASAERVETISYVSIISRLKLL